MNSPVIKPATERVFYFPTSADAVDKTKPADRKGDRKEAKTKSGAAKAARGKPEKARAESRAKPPKKASAPKPEKVVRDRFTMPKSDYRKLAELKERCLAAGVHIKKSEILRAGLLVLTRKGPKQLVAAVTKVEAVKAGRPPKT
ncbi:hypothetical protein [Cupriavidus sp. BIS7]|uniref:hypothetical protein n=1 Tax=Cupriavidus sp. BIS7 TaxID=1217718 RepID=UPI000474EE13|nr:hypothetical protein [Cupriavidus sp. BIS7]